jgi:hypothetical protein
LDVDETLPELDFPELGFPELGFPELDFFDAGLLSILTIRKPL